MKTASRILGTALFMEGFQVQDAPRYGAERRGAPIFAYVRAAKRPIQERGIIDHPGLVVVADDSLVQIPGAGVQVGLNAPAVLLIRTSEDGNTWRRRLNLAGPVLTLPAGDGATNARGVRLFGTQCAGAAARVLGVVQREHLQAALDDELAGHDAELTAQSRAVALQAFDAMAEHAGLVKSQPDPTPSQHPPPDWVELPFDPARVAAPAIHAPATSVQVRTGLWRTMRPVIDHDRCHRCHWMCALQCPDSAMPVDAEGFPHIDLDHCKGCMLCVAQCPFHVISAIPEHEARDAEEDS